jgi:hypothetical protein
MRFFRDFKGWETFRTAMVASFVALLVWVWAEGESVSRERIPLRITLDADAGSDYIYRVEDSSSWGGSVTIEVEGTPSAIAEARELRGQNLTLRFGLDGMPREPGNAKVAQLSRAVPNLSELQRLKVVVVSVDPAVLTVDVNRMVQRELPVKVELARPLLLDGEPSPSPATVTVRLPDTAASRIAEGSPPVAFVSNEELDRVRGDGARTVNAIVRLPASIGPVDPALVELRPEVISVSLRIRKEVDSFKTPPVPVWFSLPPTEDGGQWTVEILDKFVSDVVVAGPADQVARIRSGETTIKALVELTSDDLIKAVQPDRARPAAGDAASTVVTPGQSPPDSGTISRQVIFLGLPPNVAATAANSIVRVRITRNVKAANPGSGTP